MFKWLTDFAKKFQKKAAPLVTEAATVSQNIIETKPTAKDPLDPRELHHLRSGRTDGGWQALWLQAFQVQSSGQRVR